MKTVNLTWNMNSLKQSGYYTTPGLK